MSDEPFPGSPDDQLREIAISAMSNETVADIAAHIVFQETFKPPIVAALLARVAKLEAALVEVGDFLADDCVENYPFDRIPGSFADEADRLLKLIKASVEDAAQ
jgi:hypothetical protein